MILGCRTKISLNEVANHSTYALIQRYLDAGFNIRECYVDTVGAADKYQRKLSEKFPSITFTVAPKADSIYPIVSAASIAAKVSRDRQVKRWVWEEKFRENKVPSTEFGSGYPSDPATKKWISENVDPLFGFPSLVRFSWSTVTKVLEESGVPFKFEADDDESSPPKHQQQIKLTGRKRKAENGQMNHSGHAHRFSFFRARGLSRVTHL